MVCHTLLIETDKNGLVLVDTGLGTADLAQAKNRLGQVFLRFFRPELDPRETAKAQIEQMGFSVADVQHIVLTHLDLDHCGGMSDFPGARVHVLAPEYIAAMAPATAFEKQRYRNAYCGHTPRWAIYNEVTGAPWYGFECVRELAGLPPEILLVPLIGHSLGHCGVAVQQDQGGWLLHAGDAYFDHREVHASPPECSWPLKAFQNLIEVDHETNLHNRARLIDLARTYSDEVGIFCSHDAAEFSRLSSRQDSLK